MAFAAVVLFAAPAAQAEVVAATPGAFLIRAERTVSMPPAQAWDRLIHIGRWWSSTHTYSGGARNLSIDSRAGGCWCERWAGGSIEHGRVIMVMDRDGVRTLRIAAALGPLQETGASAILTFAVTPDAAGAKISMIYRVAGDPDLDLDHMAAGVNGVLMEQFESLVCASGARSRH
jgi:hypothetical protein